MEKDVWIERIRFSLYLHGLADAYSYGDFCDGMRQTCSDWGSGSYECRRMLAVSRHCGKDKTPLHHVGELLLRSVCIDHTQYGTSGSAGGNHACGRSLYSRPALNVFRRRERRRLSQSLGKKIQHRTYRQPLPHAWFGSRLPDTWHSPQRQNGISCFHVHSSSRYEWVRTQNVRRIFTGSQSEIPLRRCQYDSYPYSQRKNNHASIWCIHTSPV